MIFTRKDFHRNAGGHDDSLEVVVTTAVGCTLAFTEKAENDKVLALGLEGLDFSKKRCEGSSSGLRIVTVEEDEVRHEFLTLDELESRLTSTYSLLWGFGFLLSALVLARL